MVFKNKKQNYTYDEIEKFAVLRMSKLKSITFTFTITVMVTMEPNFFVDNCLNEVKFKWKTNTIYSGHKLV